MSRIDDLERIIMESGDNIEDIISDFNEVLTRFERRRTAEKVAAAFNEYFDKYTQFEGDFKAEDIMFIAETMGNFEELAKNADIIEKGVKKLQENQRTLEEMISEKGW